MSCLIHIFRYACVKNSDSGCFEVRVELPLVGSVAEIELDVAEKSLSLYGKPPPPPPPPPPSGTGGEGDSQFVSHPRLRSRH